MSDKKPYPTEVCFTCGQKHSTNKTDIQGSTFRVGSCDVCAEANLGVTSPRDFGYPKFKGFEYHTTNKNFWDTMLEKAIPA